MATIISTLIIIVCVLLILVVLVQNSKGGGLASSFSSSNQVMGVRKTADFLEKATWTLATSLLVLSVLSTSFNETSTIGPNNAAKESVSRQKGAEDMTPTAPENNATPVAPTPTPAPAPTTPAPSN